MFEFFQKNPALATQPLFDQVILSHLPALLRDDPRFNSRYKNLSPKYRPAILAAEISSSMVYQADFDAEFEDEIRRHVERRFK